MTKSNISNKRHGTQEIAELLALANSVPPEVELPLPRPSPTFIEEILELIRSEPFQGFRELTGPVEPDTFLKKLIGPSAPITHNKVVGRYIQLRDSRELLRAVAAIGDLIPTMTRIADGLPVGAPIGESSRAEAGSDDIKSPRQRSRWMMPSNLHVHISIETDEEGRIRFNTGFLLQALAGVEAARIRQCQICRYLFWASRTDQACCSKRCSHNLRTRRWRERYLERYKQRRMDKTQQGTVHEQGN